MEPFLPERVDISGAVAAATIANVNRGKGQKAYSIDDFMIVQQSNRNVPQADNDAREDAHLIATILAFGGS